MTQLRAVRSAPPDTPVESSRVQLLLALSAFALFYLPGVLGTYGYFIDELYYIACAKRLAWGYVDQPPASLALLAAVRAVLGDSLWAIRLVPALAGALTVWLSARLARRFGADAYGQALAGLAVMSASVLQILFGFYSMNSLQMLVWLGCLWLLIEIEERDEPRLWLAFGALAGVGLLNKHTLLLLALGLALAMPFTRARRHLASPWLWAGAGLALLLVSPNLLWLADNDWVSLEFYRNADLHKNNPTPPTEVVLQQLLTMNPGTAPVWLAGLAFFLFTESGRRHRQIGLVFVVLLALLALGQKSRPDRLAGLYPVLFAAGGVLLGRLAADRRWLRVTLPAWMLVNALFFLPIGSPVLPPEPLARFTAALGVVPQIESGEGKTSRLPQWFADRTGWEELAGDVDRALARAGFGPEDRVAIFAPSYGQAGALELLRGGPGYPEVYSSHNSYFLWGPPPEEPTAALVLGEDEESLRRLFERVELLSRHDCAYCMRWRDEMPIWKVERPREPVASLWPRFRDFG